MPTSLLHSFSLPGAMTQRGFWLYVWRVDTPKGERLYVGRTGDNSSPNATAPYTRMGQHLGKVPNQNALRQHLAKCGIEPEQCTSFELIAHGPIYAEVPKDKLEPSERMAEHLPLRNDVGAMERNLRQDLHDAGYCVMNEVRWRFELSPEGQEKWNIAREAFREAFPRL